ncbi:hypothetical protein [Paraburkholderia humisilvae]|uniref:Abi-like protein n=1 Tax=Paraburkholderia humisilvae TaxID=627669 RepID=A0A6J5EQC3_9BURK|nr:hypothetical protein [Paraburkholderia humisilvae]CAB3768669.1 hypothetical protein LMG29542_05918 [Paraburkholderia humisilvae]
MPHNIPASVVTDTFSLARISAFHAFFKAENQAQCLGALVWHQSVAAAMWPLICLVEISLRNRLHVGLSRMYAAAWYAGARNSMPLQTKLQSRADELLSATDAAGNARIGCPDDFVAAMSFGFWVEVLRQVHVNRRYRLVEAIFPNYGPLKDKKLWADAAKTWIPLLRRLERHKRVRDQIGHHTPLWNIKYTVRETEPPRVPKSPGAMMLALRQEVSSLRQTLLDMDVSLARLWDGTFFQQAFLQLTTTNGLYYYMYHTADSGKVLRPFRETRYLSIAELQASGVPRLV